MVEAVALTADQENDRMTTEWLDPASAARRIGVNRQLIYDAIATGGLKHVRLGGRRNIRIRLSDLDAWMVAREVVRDSL